MEITGTDITSIASRTGILISSIAEITGVAISIEPVDAPTLDSFVETELKSAEFYFGCLNYTPNVVDGTTTVTVTGGKTFPTDVVGMEIVTNRIHKNPEAYPSGSENYVPTGTTCRYATVTERTDSTTIVIDKVINGGNDVTPVSVTAQDGYIFTDCRDAIKAATEATEGNSTVVLSGNKTYVTKGLPFATPNKNITFKHDGTGSKPILMISVEDGFNVAENGVGGSAPSFDTQYGSNRFFNVYENNSDVTFENIDICPSIYEWSYAQDGHPQLLMFYDPSGDFGEGIGFRQIINSDWARIRDLMVSELGSEREEAVWLLPDIANGAHGGGTIVDGDVDKKLTYKLRNTEWNGLTPMGIKNKYKGGSLFIIDNDTPLEFRENIKSKATSYEEVETSFTNQDGGTLMTILDGTTTFYSVANQDWNGGTKTNSKCFNYVTPFGSRLLNLGNGADFRELNGGVSGELNPFINGSTARMFSKIPEVGDIITEWQSGYTGTGKRGMSNKVSDTELWVWGYFPNVGDVWKEKTSDVTATITDIEEDWIQGYVQTTANGHIHVSKLTFNSAITTNLADCEFEVISSSNEYLLTGAHDSTHGIDREEVGHLMYIDGGVGLKFKNVKAYGLWRSSTNNSTPRADFTSVDGTPMVGDIITGVTSGETSTINYINISQKWMQYDIFDGMFIEGEDFITENGVTITNNTLTFKGLFSAQDEATFENVEVYNVGGGTGGIGSQWQPNHMRYKQILLDKTTTEMGVNVIGGKMYALQGNFDFPRLNITGKPTMLAGSRMYAPTINGGIETDGKIFIHTKGHDVDLSDSDNLNVDVHVEDSASIDINSTSGSDSPIEGRKYGIDLYSTTVNPEVELSGDVVDMPITIINDFNEANTTVLVTNHSGVGDYFNDKPFRLPFTPSVYPSAKLSVTDTDDVLIIPSLS